MCVEKYRYEGTSTRFGEGAYENYLLSVVDLHDMGDLAAQRCIKCDDVYEKLGEGIPHDENE